MNDFTKEELRCLDNSIKVTLGREPVSDSHYDFHCALRLKIQSLIDNYDVKVIEDKLKEFASRYEQQEKYPGDSYATD